MLVALVVIVLCQTFGTSIPLAIPSFIIELRDEQPTVPAPSLPNYRIRTRFDIIWSCLSTLFICTWIAIHPNIPTRKRSPIWALLKRIRLMIWALIVPELILIWAYKQWAAARYVAKRFKRERWTATHGHFLIMGGFVLVRDGQETVLDYESFVKGDLAYEVAFPTVTAKEILDKSRGDFLSKSIAILQSIWFIVECITRGKEGLALTELELVTLALASLNGVMYFLWWDKPLGVKEPIKVYLRNADPPKMFLEKHAEEESPDLELTFVQKFCHIPFRRLRCSFSQHYRSAVSLCGTVLTAVYYRLSIILSEMSSLRDQVINSEDIPFGEYLWPLYLPLYWIFVFPVMLLGTSLFDIAATSTSKPDAAHVPTFYAPDTDPSGDTEGMLFFIALPIVATAFGALHLLAWNFQFPSHIEQLLWRIASLTITGIPAAPLALEIAAGALFVVAFAVVFIAFIPLFIMDFLEERFGFHFRLPDWSISLPDIVWNILGWLFLPIWVLAEVIGCLAEPIFTCVALIIVGILALVLPTALVGYMVARLVLLSQAVVLLREQPASAFYAINWTGFLPHV